MREHYDGNWYGLKDRDRIDDIRLSIINDGVTPKDIIHRAERRVEQYGAVRHRVPSGTHWPTVEIAIKNERNFLLFALGMETPLYNTNDLQGLIGAFVLGSPFLFIFTGLLVDYLREYDTEHGTSLAILAGIAAVGMFVWGLYIAVRNEQIQHTRDAWERGLLHSAYARRIIENYDRALEKLKK